MTERQKLILQINTPTTVTLLYDEPVTGNSQYGTYNLYAVESNGIQYSYFAPDIVHEKLKQLCTGETAVITKLAAMRNNKVVTAYDVVLPRKVAVASENPSSVIKPYVEFDTSDQSEVDNDKGNIGRDKSYDIMLQSLKDAISISSELGGTISAERVAITLFIHRIKSNNYGG